MFITDLRALFRLWLIVGFMLGASITGGLLVFVWYLWLRAI